MGFTLEGQVVDIACKHREACEQPSSGMDGKVRMMLHGRGGSESLKP